MSAAPALRVVPDVDLEMARGFLALIDPDASQFQFSMLLNTGKRDYAIERFGALDELAQVLRNGNLQGEGVYFTVSASDGHGTLKANIVGTRALYADYDHGLPAPTSFPLHPSLTVYTSVVDGVQKGQHYWLINLETSEPVVTLDDLEGMNRRIRGDEGDKSVGKRNQLMRLPGFFNMKPAARRYRVRYESHADAEGNVLEYTPDELRAAFPPLAKATAIVTPVDCEIDDPHEISFVRRRIDKSPGVDEGGRNAALVNFAGLANDHAISEEAMLELLEPWGERCSPPLDMAGDESRRGAFCRAYQGCENALGCRTTRAQLGDILMSEAEAERWYSQFKVPATPPDAPRAQRATGLVTQRGSEMQMRRLEWLWRHRLPRGMCSLLAGHGGLGKTTVLLDIAARCSTGAAWPDDPNQPAPTGQVIYFSGEDSPEITLLPRYVASGGDPRMIHFVKGVTTAEGRRTFNLQADLALLDAKIAAVGQTTLVIFDPISSYFGNADTYRNTEVRSVLEPIVDMASRRDVTVIGNTHLAKGSKGNANARVLDSVAMTATGRSVYMVIEDADDPERRLFIPSKANLGPRVDGLAFRVEVRTVDAVEDIVGSYVVWERNRVKTTADEALGAMDAKMREPSARDLAIEFLRDALADGPKPSDEVIEAAKAAGHSERTLARARIGLRIKTTKSEMTGGWVMALP